eukprot:1161587-Pelagomonas_calceolata.AAC.24
MTVAIGVAGVQSKAARSARGDACMCVLPLQHTSMMNAAGERKSLLAIEIHCLPSWKSREDEGILIVDGQAQG